VAFSSIFRGVASIFQKGGSPDCHYGQDIVVEFSPPVLGSLVKKGLQKGGSRAPRDPLGYALDIKAPE